MLRPRSEKELARRIWPHGFKRAVAAVSGIGAAPTLRAANGGLGADWMVRHGVPTVTFGAGQNESDTVDEWINLDEYDRACALALPLATMR
jgi:tripeptide aminopeptidase